MLCQRLKGRSVPARKYFGARAAKLAILGLTFADACLARAQKLESMRRIALRTPAIRRPVHVEEGPMRFLFGIVVGILLTVGSAYLFDVTRKGEGPNGADRQIVNWDVVQAQLKILSGNIQDGWSRLTGRKAE
jgi:hypothetical protein